MCDIIREYPIHVNTATKMSTNLNQLLEVFLGPFDRVNVKRKKQKRTNKKKSCEIIRLITTCHRKGRGAFFTKLFVIHVMDCVLCRGRCYCCCCYYYHHYYYNMFVFICKNISSDLHEEESAATSARYVEIELMHRMVVHICDIDKANCMHIAATNCMGDRIKKKLTTTTTPTTTNDDETQQYDSSTAHTTRVRRTPYSNLSFALYEIRITLKSSNTFLFHTMSVRVSSFAFVSLFLW